MMVLLQVFLSVLLSTTPSYRVQNVAFVEEL